MNIDAKLLTLAQWLSPAFPIGAFAYSHGIEAAVEAGWIGGAEDLQAWLADCLTDGSGRADAIWLRLAHGADDPLEVDAMARSFALSAERLREADAQGAAFVGTVNAVWDQHLPDMVLPVAVGHAARVCGLEAEATVSLYLHSFVSNIVTASLRLSPIGQTAGQRVIARLQPLCLRISEETRGAELDDVCGNAFLSDIAAMTHETLQPRLFQS